MNIAYHWKKKTIPILCMAIGIALTAALMSRTAFRAPLGVARISRSASSDGVSSLVRAIAVSTVSRMHTVPIQKQVYIQ